MALSIASLFTISMILHHKYSTPLLRAHNDLEKETTLHFFLHDTPGGRNPSAVKIVAPSDQSRDDTSQTPFGTVWVVDDPLTLGPERDSAVIGNSKGMYVSAGRHDRVMVAYLDFVFTIFPLYKIDGRVRRGGRPRCVSDGERICQS
ncbi:PREDICTED: dirigent protein 4-like [Tarenaya hassleriana]|uniref:dirigent protein 4-like n=1 Tax=Tarenaya hassleriana TaxID=28532 RepID=UPI00053C949D|nr:PREDICTED: dirigent protein 4-like [Tarenaya hassleriana]